MDAYEWKLRQDLCETGRRLYQAGFMAGSDGNLSTILNDDELLITPSRLSKGYLEPHQITKIDRKGKKLEGDLPPSSEMAMHLAAYEERPDVCSVAHCHPPILTAFNISGQSVPQMVLNEFELMFGGQLPIAPYALPGSPALADSIREFIREPGVNVVLLDHHGAISVGQDIFQAGMKMEHAESAAKIVMYARMLGGEKPLPKEAESDLREAHKRLVSLESRIFTGYCRAKECKERVQLGTAPAAAPAKDTITEADLEAIVSQIVEKVLAA